MIGSGNHIVDEYERQMNLRDVCTDCGYTICKCDAIYEERKDFNY